MLRFDGVALAGWLAGLLFVHMSPELPLVSPVGLVAFCILALALLFSAFRLFPTSLDPVPVWRRWGSRLALFCGCALLAFSYTHWRATESLADALPAAWEGRDILLEGSVDSLPQRLSDTPRPAWRFELRTERVLTDEAQVPKRLLLNWYGDTPSSRYPPPNDEAADEEEREISPGLVTLQAGQRWRLLVRLKQPHGLANPGGFDYEGWLLEHGLRATGYVRSAPHHEAPILLGQGDWQFSQQINRWRQQLRSRLLQALPAEETRFTGILIGLAIGDQHAITNEQWSLFNRTGLTHLMVVSGSHITLIAALLAYFATRLWCRFPTLALAIPGPKVAVFVGLLGAFFYTWLSGLGLPALRTLSMLTAVAFCRYLDRRISWARTLGISLLIVLLYDPWAVTSAGFWLSFATVAALLLVSQESDQGRWSRVRHWLRSQWAATLATLPLLLCFFQQWPWISPLANVLGIPVIGLLVTPLTLLGTVLFCLPGQLSGMGLSLLWLADHLLQIVILTLQSLVDWLPTTLWQAPAAPLEAVLLAGMGMFLLLLPPVLPGSRLLGLFSLLPVLFWPVERPAEGVWWADVLDVGQGQAVLIRTKEHTLLYDSGPRYGTPAVGVRQMSHADAAQRVILPFLRQAGIRQLDLLVVSHRDSDHAGGTQTLQTQIPITEVRSPGVNPGDLPCLSGQHWEWSGVSFSFLHPTPEVMEKTGKGNSNASSCVLQISGDQGRFLLTGDLPASLEEKLVAEQPLSLPTDILLAPHHGSRFSSSEAFLAATGARTVVISAGYRNRFAHPHPTVLARYQAQGMTIWRTDRDGAIAMRPRTRPSDGNTDTSFSAWRSMHRRYWHWRTE